MLLQTRADYSGSEEFIIFPWGSVLLLRYHVPQHSIPIVSPMLCRVGGIKFLFGE